MNADYIKSNITKHIAPKLFYPHELQKNGEIEILQIKSYAIILQIYSQSLYLHCYSENMFSELVSDGLRICMYQGD